MDFAFNINKLLRDEITTVDSRLQPCRQYGIDRTGFQQLQRMLYDVVNRMGDASAKAQGLHGSITTGKKLEHTNHHLYIMKDAEGNGGLGSVVGILKVGHKKLFVYDSMKSQHELEPLCVLDFYVHESRQRMGCGRKLFDFMLSREAIPAEQLAIDRPSPKFLSFLKKHYKLQASIPQVNNFVIFEGFFNGAASGQRTRRNRTPGGFSHHSSSSRPLSGRGVGSLGHQESKPLQLNGLRTRHQHSPTQTADSRWAPQMGRQSASHMGAGDMMYSRHRATPPSSSGGTPPHPGIHRNDTRTPTRNVQSNYTSHQQLAHSHPYQELQERQQNHNQGQFPSSLNTNGNHATADNNEDSIAFYKQLNSQSSPSTYYNMGSVPYRRGHILEHLPPKPPAAQILRQTGLYPASTPNFGNRGAGTEGDRSSAASAYPSPNSNSHQISSIPANSASPHNKNPFMPSSSNVADHSLTLPACAQQENVSCRPPSGKQVNSTKTGSSQPPLLQREGPPASYKNMLNMHQTFQGRNGHLTVPSGPNALSSPETFPYASSYNRGESQNTSWTVSGVLREQRLNAPLSNRYYSSSRLW